MRLKVEPDVVALAPGDVTDLLVRVHNDGEDTCTPYLQVRGADPDDVLLPDEVVAVPAGSVMTAVVRVRAAVDAVPGDQRIAVAAEDLDGAQGTVSATTVLRIGARPDVAVEVDPVATVGRRGAKARTILRNRSDRRLQVELEGRGEGVRVSFRPSRVTLDPGETKRVPTRMRRAQRSWFGEIRHGAVITARGIGAPASTTATFTQKPSVPRPAVRGVAALTALAVWVAATVVVFNRINAEPEAGPDAGVVAAPAAPGPGRTSATGLFVEAAEEGVRLPVVIQGTIEGPRDPAGTTVTAERIGFGDQGTTTGLTKVVALAEVKLPRGNVLDVVRTSTDERGRFRIASGLVEDAFYRVTAVRAGFEVGSFIVSTSAEQPEVTLAIALEPATGSLAGTVTDAVGDPVGGATVVVTDGSAAYTTVTPSEGDGVGTWVLEGLATPATYQVLVSRRGFAAQTLIVELDGGQALRGVDAVLTADLGTIVGRITDANPDPNQPSVAQGVGALTVTVAGPEARETRTLTVAGDLRGTFDLPGLPYGDYSITFAGDGWETRQAEVTVDRGLVRLDATVNRSTGLVQGWVWQVATGPTDLFPGAFQGACRYPRISQREGTGAADSGTRARPCGGVAVTVESDEGELFATATATDTGFFQIGGVPAGEYTLTLSRPGYVSDVRAIVVSAGGTFELNPLRTASVVPLDDAVEGRDFIQLGLAAPPAVCAGSVLLTLIDFRDGTGVDPVTDASAPGVVTVSNAADCDPVLTVTRVATSGSYLLQNVPLGPQVITVEGDAADWAYEPVTISVQVSPLDRVSLTQNILPRPRTLTLPAGTIRLDGPAAASRDVVVEVINASGTNVGPIGGTVIPVAGNGTNAQVDLDLVGPDRDLRLRAVAATSSGYEAATSASFELPPGTEPFELPLLAGSAPRLSLVATTTVTGRIFGFTASPLALAPLEGATVTFPAQSRPAAGDTGTLTVTTGADGAFSATVRAGSYLQGATTARASGVFGAVSVAASGYDTRLFNPSSGTPLALTDPTEVLRESGTSFFLLYGAVGGGLDGDVGLDPVARDVTIPVRLIGAPGASRTLSVALSDGTVLEGADPRATPTPTPTPPGSASVDVGTDSSFTFTGVRPGNYTVTVTGDDAVTTTATLTVPVGAVTFTAPNTVEVVATTTVTGTVHVLDPSLQVVPLDGASIAFPAGSDPSDPSGSVTVTSGSAGSAGSFSVTVRSGAYTSGALNAVVVTPPDGSHTARSFETTLVGGSATLVGGEDPFLLNPALTGVGAGAGEFVLTPATRDVRIDVSLLGDAGAERPVTVTLTAGTVTGAPTPTATATASSSPAHPTTVEVATPGAFSFDAVAPGTYTLTIAGDDHRGLSEPLFVIPPGQGLFSDARSVQATVDVTVDVTETVVLGATTTTGAAVPGVLVAASAAGAASDSAITDANGEAVLTLDSGVTYTLSVTKTGYASPSGLTVDVGALATQSVGVTLPASLALRVFGVVSDRVRSVQVLDGATEVEITTGLGAGTKSYAVDGLPTNTLLRVDFRDGSGTVLVSRWIQSDQAGNVSIQLDQDAEGSDLGDMTVTVEIAEHPSGTADTPAWVRIELTEVVPAGFRSISPTGSLVVWKPRTGSATAGIYTVAHTFEALADPRSSGSLPDERFAVAVALVTADEGNTDWSSTRYRATGAGWVAQSDAPRATHAQLDAVSPSTVRFETVPGAPENLVATAVAQAGPGSTQQASVSWTAPTNTGGATSAFQYRLEYRKGSDEFVSVDRGLDTSATLSGLDPGTTYDIRVFARNTAVGAGALGEGVAAITTVTTADVPTAPTITGITPGDGQLSVAFTAGGNGGSAITTYEYSLDGGAWTSRGSGTTGSPLDITGLTNGTAYQVRIRAVNAVGSGAESNSVSATPRTVPGAPQSLTLDSATTTSLNVSWTAPASDGGDPITGYTATATASGQTTRNCTTTGSPPATSCTISNLSSGTSYTVTVTATNGAGTGAGASQSFSTVADSLLALASTGGYQVARSGGSSPGTYVERGWFFRVDREVTVDELYGGGAENRTWTLRLRDAGTGATPTTGGTILGTASVAGIACTSPSLPGDKITVGSSVGTVKLFPGTWYAVTSQDESNNGPHCNATSDTEVAFGAAGTSTRRYGGTPGVPVGFRVSSIP